MHQTFYIDVDEEISSVIDRLRKSMAVDNYFVVPKRALFLQSIVNMKLLKRESEKIGKHAIIITQDEIGASMAKRSGIDVRESVEGLDPIADSFVEDDTIDDSDISIAKKSKVLVKKEHEKQVRLSGVGSSGFYDQGKSVSEEGAGTKVSKSIGSQVSPRQARPSQKIVKRSREEEYTPVRIKKPMPSSYAGTKHAQVHGIVKDMNGVNYKKQMDPGKEKTLERMFLEPHVIHGEQKKTQTSQKKEGRAKKIIVWFVFVCLLVFVGVAVYLFFPSATINIILNIQKKKVDVNIHGKDLLRIDQSEIPIRVIDKEENVTFTYAVTGKRVASGKKAQGSVVVYNNFSSSSQALIATTRLESTGGKIFRLAKSVVVPGTTTVAGEIKPGAIEADVIADQPGADFNIEPTDFTVPGFKGGPKYDKFYAKSSVAMSGGSADDGDGAISVSQRDIDSAKQQAEAMLKEKIAQSIKSELRPDEEALDQAQKITIIKSGTTAKIGDAAGSFDYITTGSVHALVFSQNDVKKVVEQSFNSDQHPLDINEEVTKIEYGNADPNFDNNSLEIRVNGEVTMTPKVDIIQVERDLLGKDDTQIRDVLKKYPSIKSINVELNPTFVSRIPQYSQRVKVGIITSE